MNYFLDTEFSEQAGDNPTIELISIAITTSGHDSLYLESNEFNEDLCSDWVKENVLPQLQPALSRISRETIRREVIEFVGNDPDPVFWAYYADYDWVAFCWLFGTMMDLPKNFPMMCMDLQQWWIQQGKPNIKPPTPSHEHHAMADAVWNRQFYDALLEEHNGRWGDED